jgi:hypothetical protein
MNPSLADSIQAALDGRASEAEIEFLNSELRRNSAARDLYLQMADLHSCLAVEERLWPARFRTESESSGRIATRKPAGLLAWLWRPWGAAVAGLVLGLSGASVAWAIAAPWSPRVVTLPNRGFEELAGRLPSGVPLSAGVWSGDDAEVVMEDSPQGNKPRKLLRFLQAAGDASFPNGPANSCDVFSVVDLRRLRKLAETDGENVLQVSAAFSDRRAEAGEQIRFACRIHVFSGSIDSLRSTWPKPDANLLSSGFALLESRGGTPQEVRLLRAKTVLPAEGDYALLQLAVTKIRAQARTPAVFGRQYVSDVSLTLKTQSRSPVSTSAPQ